MENFRPLESRERIVGVGGYPEVVKLDNTITLSLICSARLLNFISDLSKCGSGGGRVKYYRCTIIIENSKPSGRGTV